jgi:serine/alanine racemase
MAFTAEADMRIATICIGYADGLPRELSHQRGCVLINGYRAPIIGRICMDQTIVDVTEIPELHPGDTAVIIGRSGNQEITAGDLARQCDTITNEILSRLGARLEQVLK